MIYTQDNLSIGSMGMYHVAITISDIPITIYVNHISNSKIGAYVLSIYGKSYSKGEVVSTVLKNSEDFEAVRSIGQIVAKRYQRPVYLNINGRVDSSDILAYIRALTETIDSLLENDS